MKNKASAAAAHMVKEPVQKRSRETVRKIVEAARALFTELGFEETTTHLIADKAGLSVGGIYAHFKSKEDIFLYILEMRSRDAFRVTEECVAEIREKQMPLDRALDHLIETWWAAHTRHGKLNREMLKFCIMNEAAAKIHDDWEQAESDEIRVMMRDYRNDLAETADIEAAMTVVARATHEVFHYLYREKDRVDETAVLSALLIMIKKFLLK